MQGLHWKTVGGAILALLAMFIPWAWPAMPGFLHLVVWPVVAVGAYYSLHGWMKERRASGQMAFDPPQLIIFIGIAIALIGVVWQLYRFAFGSGTGAPVPVVAGNPEVVLIAPEERHEIIWDPKNDPEIRIGVEGKMVEGRWSVPTFQLRATNDIAIQDATVEWRADMISVSELLKSSPRLTDNKVSLNNGDRDKILIPSSGNKAGWVYDVLQTASQQIPFVTPNPPGAAAFIPLDVFTNAMLYTVAKLPDGLGAELTPIPFTVTVTWTYPTPGRQQFSVVGTAKNVKPADVPEPLIHAVMQFSVKRID